MVEKSVIDCNDSSKVYICPKIMNEKCPYIKEWDDEWLLSMTDFTDKVVLDVGVGTRRPTLRLILSRVN